MENFKNLKAFKNNTWFWALPLLVRHASEFQLSDPPPPTESEGDYRDSKETPRGPVILCRKGTHPSLHYDSVRKMEPKSGKKIMSSKGHG